MPSLQIRIERLENRAGPPQPDNPYAAMTDEELTAEIERVFGLAPGVRERAYAVGRSINEQCRIENPERFAELEAAYGTRA